MKAYEEYTIEELSLMRTDEYKKYLKTLCRIASFWVSRIRVQFAEKAFEMYKDPTVRKIVAACGEEYEELDKDRQRDFEFVAKYGATTPEHLNDSCLNNANAYAKTLYLLFDIKFGTEG